MGLGRKLGLPPLIYDVQGPQNRLRKTRLESENTSKVLMGFIRNIRFFTIAMVGPLNALCADSNTSILSLSLILSLTIRGTTNSFASVTSLSIFL